MKRQYGVALVLVSGLLAPIPGVVARSSLASTQAHATIQVPHAFAHAKGVAGVFPHGR